MSVLVSKRTLSRHEYVNTFLELYKFTEEKLSKIAKRKYRWIAEPIANQMNEIYNLITQANNDYFCYGIKLLDKPEQSKLIIGKLIDLQKPLFALWNIEDYETRKMVNWVNYINKEIMYLLRLGCISHDERLKVFILDYKAMNEAEFIRTMSKLHKIIYSKTISLKESLRSTKGVLLMNLADEAFYRVCHANLYFPINRKMYENRKEDMSIAIDCLKQMQQPLAALFNIMNYSENTMNEIAKLLDKEMTLLEAVYKSDIKRFKNL